MREIRLRPTERRASALRHRSDGPAPEPSHGRESIPADKYLWPPRAPCDGSGVVCAPAPMSAKLDSFAPTFFQQESSEGRRPARPLITSRSSELHRRSSGISARLFLARPWRPNRRAGCRWDCVSASEGIQAIVRGWWILGEPYDMSSSRKGTLHFRTRPKLSKL